jgi:ElaB/YqjD/DUF883 family membrane-anchored ribosome-binding protein
MRIALSILYATARTSCDHLVIEAIEELAMQSLSTPSESVSNGQRAGVKSSLAAAIDVLPSRVSREYHHFVADIEDLIADATSLTGDDLARAKAKIRDRIAAAKVSIEEMGGVIVQRARKTAVATDTYVREQPWKAVGIGAGVGLLLGFVFTLARRK